MFLDANVLYAAAYSRSSALRRLWEVPEAELLTSDSAASEALVNLSEDRPTRIEDLQRLMARVRVTVGVAERCPLPEEVNLPPSDHRILCSAIHANATHFLTNDKTHFGSCFGRLVAGTLILRPWEYLLARS